MTFRFAVRPRWDELPHVSAVLNAVSAGEYVVDDYRTTLTIKSVRRGEAWYETPQGRYLVTPENFLVLNHEQHYAMRIDAEMQTETLCPFFQPGFVKGEFCERLYPMRGRIADTLRSIGAVPLEDSFYDLADALSELRGEASKESTSFPGLRTSTREEMYCRLYRARDFLYSCFAEPVSVADAAHIAAMSPFHFQRMFKRAFGISPMQFVQRRRLEVARQRLATTDDDVTSICFSIGFESLGSFSSLFKRTFGVAPSKIRRIEEAAATRMP